jgi:hypothetical protein
VLKFARLILKCRAGVSASSSSGDGDYNGSIHFFLATHTFVPTCHLDMRRVGVEVCKIDSNSVVLAFLRCTVIAAGITTTR